MCNTLPLLFKGNISVAHCVPLPTQLKELLSNDPGSILFIFCKIALKKTNLLQFIHIQAIQNYFMLSDSIIDFTCLSTICRHKESDISCYNNFNHLGRPKEASSVTWQITSTVFLESTIENIHFNIHHAVIKASTSCIKICTAHRNFALQTEAGQWPASCLTGIINTMDNNNNNNQDNVYGAVITVEPLREFTRFI